MEKLWKLLVTVMFLSFSLVAFGCVVNDDDDDDDTTVVDDDDDAVDDDDATDTTDDDDDADADEDGIIDDEDNCVDVANEDQLDTDLDEVGDACDNCIDLENPSQDDVDSDGVGDSCGYVLDADSATAMSLFLDDCVGAPLAAADAASIPGTYLGSAADEVIQEYGGSGVGCGADGTDYYTTAYTFGIGFKMAEGWGDGWAFIWPANDATTQIMVAVCDDGTVYGENYYQYARTDLETAYSLDPGLLENRYVQVTGTMDTVNGTMDGTLWIEDLIDWDETYATADEFNVCILNTTITP